MVRQRRRFVWEIDWNLLRTFMVIVQEHGLTAAGEKLSLKQPTVSNALKRLETHMGCRLVERNASHFAVTPAGQRLFSECVALFEIVSGLPEQIEEQPGDPPAISRSCWPATSFARSSTRFWRTSIAPFHRSRFP